MEIGYAIDAEIQAKMKFNNITWRWGDINISQNKSFEYQFEFGSSTPTNHPFEIRFLITEKCDHCGPSITFGIMNLFWFCLKIYDHRHWNTKGNRWYNTGETEIPGDEYE